MYKNRSRGFTLIELLVVIAIIGILSAVVLASLNTARTKGNDAAIQSDLDTVRTEAEVQYGTLGNKYSGTTSVISSATCSTLVTANTIFADTAIQNALKGVLANSGSDSDCGVTATGDAYSIASALKTSGFWCIDSTGVSRGTMKDGVTKYVAISGSATNAAHTAAGATVCN